MSSRHLHPLLCMALIGTCNIAAAATATVYYYLPYKSWTTVNIHHNGSGAWTAVPGNAMAAACTGWVSKTVDFGTLTSFEAVFNNGAGAWDNQLAGGSNYIVPAGVHQVKNGVLQSGAGTPCTVDTTAPTTPVLSAGKITSTSIALSWTASTDASGIKGYGIVRNGKLIKKLTGTSYTNTGLTPSTAYIYKVIAEDNAGNRSAYSATQTLTTQLPDIIKPTTPTGLTKGVVTSASVALTWTASTDASGIKGYGILRNGSLVGTTSSTSYTDTKNLTPATQYSYTLVAEDKSGNRSGVSSPLSVTTDVADTTPPSSTGTLSGTLVGSTVNLSWVAATDDKAIGGYVITRTGGTASKTFTTDAPVTTYADSSGVAGTAYTWTVKARDTSNNLSINASNSVVKTIPNAGTAEFTWDNATVYFVMNDRFVNADTSNDRSYCRESNASCQSFGNDLTQMPSAFHGGDLKGITQKINSNYFKDLGINAIWITAPYEQMHGFVYGNDHKHYGYHGYYTLDWTAIDKNMGTKEDLKTLVDAAHAQGIRVVMDIVLNHVGYENIKDMNEYGYGKLKTGWENTAYKTGDTLGWDADIGKYIDYTDAVWGSTFWSTNWVRMNSVAGVTQCTGTDGLTGCVGYLPDIKTELSNAVSLPPILNTKWTREGRLSSEQSKLDTWFAANGKTKNPANHIIKWLSDYVREYGIDGFRVDTAKHVELSVWKDLKTEAIAARNEWLAANPTKAAALTGDKTFWMTGEIWNHGTDRNSYFDYGFDSLINFNFQGAAGNVAGLDSTYNTLAAVNTNNAQVYNLLSYISSHDKGLFDRSNLQTGLTSLLLAPGGVQLFYGDETARPLMGGNWAGDHAWRGDMNWNSINTALLTHAQKLGKFRNNHIAVGAGLHAKLADAPYTFSRIKDTDKVVMAIGASGTVAVNVGGVFADGTVLRDAYTGLQSTVAGGKANIAAHANGVVLLEKMQ